MKLDERIEKLSDIFNCFNAEKAKQFIGQKGYFANDLNYFSNIHSCYYDTLAEVKDCDRPFKDEDCCPWSFFIPEYFLKPKEKKYRSFTLQEFERFAISQPFHIVVFRYKGKTDEYHGRYNGYILYDDGDIYITLGDNSYDIKKIVDNYELYIAKEWQPFGVEVEE